MTVKHSPKRLRAYGSNAATDEDIMTSIFDMNTGTYTDYSLSPFDGVIAAYAQREQLNFNTWTYDQYVPLVTIIESVRPDVVCVTCGNQTCLAQKGNEHNELQHDWERRKA